MNKDTANIVSGLALLVGTTCLYVYTLSASYKMGKAVSFDAGLVPRIWLAVAGLCATAMVVKGIAGRLRAGAAGERLAAVAPRRFVFAFGLTVLFVVAFTFLGYWISVLAFIPAFSLCFGYRDWKGILFGTAVFSIVTWVVFVNLLEVRMDAFPFLVS